MAGDMFTIPASAMRDIIESLDANPISYSYPHQAAIGDLATTLPSSQSSFDFINYVGEKSQNLFGVLKEAESLSERIADYDGVTPAQTMASMVGSLLPEFAATFSDWKKRSLDAANHPAIYSEMAAIVINEPAAFERARTITAKIAETMAVIRAADNSDSKPGAVPMPAMAGGAPAAIQKAIKTLAALQQIAEFGTSMPPPGQEFKKYLEDLTSSIESAISSGAIKMVDGALKMVRDGIETVLPSGIVDAYKTLSPEARALIDKVSNIVNSVDTSISEAQRAINKLKGQG